MPTAQLNQVLSDAVSRHQPPPTKGHRPRFYYATQAAIEPPTFVLFASEADVVHFSYQRFLENRIRDAFGFEGAPLRLIFRERSRVELEPKQKRSTRPRKGALAGGGGASDGPPRVTWARAVASAHRDERGTDPVPSSAPARGARRWRCCSRAAARSRSWPVTRPTPSGCARPREPSATCLACRCGMA